MKKLKFKALVKSILSDLNQLKSKVLHFKLTTMAMMMKEETIKL